MVRDEDGLEDRISVGLLARAFPRARVEAVIEASVTRERRVRMLPGMFPLWWTPDLVSCLRFQAFRYGFDAPAFHRRVQR